MENGRDDTIQLLTRHWLITDARGMINMVDGEGVVGETPILGPGESHDYVSGCPLATPHGSMEGHYTFQDEGGRLFEVAIPFFPLAAPAAEAG
jgi:ApaG protein